MSTIGGDRCRFGTVHMVRLSQDESNSCGKSDLWTYWSSVVHSRKWISVVECHTWSASNCSNWHLHRHHLKVLDEISLHRACPFAFRLSQYTHHSSNPKPHLFLTSCGREKRGKARKTQQTETPLNWPPSLVVCICVRAVLSRTCTVLVIAGKSIAWSKNQRMQRGRSIAVSCCGKVRGQYSTRSRRIRFSNTQIRIQNEPIITN